MRRPSFRKVREVLRRLSTLCCFFFWFGRDLGNFMSLITDLKVMAYNFQTRKVYSFNVYPSAILGTGFKNATLQAILDYDSALAFSDLAALHIDVYPSLPAGTPNRPQDFDYLLLRMDNGASTVIGVPWIIEESIEVVQSLKINALIEDVSSADLERVRACLSQNGFDKITLELIGA